MLSATPWPGMRLPSLSTRAVGAPLFNPACLYMSGGPDIQEDEFAVFCFFGISSTFDNGIWCSTANDFGSFASVSMPKAPDFIILKCSEGLCSLLIKWTGLKWIPGGEELPEQGEGQTLTCVYWLSPPVCITFVVPLEEGGFFLFPEIWDVEFDQTLHFEVSNVQAILKFPFIKSIYRSSFLLILVTTSLIKNAIQGLVSSYRNERSIHEQHFICK